MIHIREIDHIVLRTNDVQRMVEFYCNVLGCTVEKRQESFGLIQLRAGNSLLDLVYDDEDSRAPPNGRSEPPGRVLDHFCFRIDSFAPLDLLSYLSQLGIETDTPRVRYGAEGAGTSIYIKDPDGNTVELKGPPDTAVSA